MKILVFVLSCFLSAPALSSDLEIKNVLGEASSTTKRWVIHLKNAGDHRVLESIQSTAGIKSVESFYPTSQAPFNRYLNVVADGESVIEKIRSLSGVLRVEPVFEVEQESTTAPELSVEPNLQGGLSSLSVVVGGKPKLLSNDPLFAYQWALLNSGQVVYRDITDIKLEKVVGEEGVDIGWNPVLNPIEKSFKKDVVVAVLDYGLNVSHPDIKANLFLNEKECVRGKVPRGNAKEDKDGNGFVGDCIGWNFAEEDNKRNRNRVKDRKGHGTHVAGIVSAESQNSVGISGVSNRIKILPIKVLKTSDDKKGGEKGLSLTDRVAKALIYATDRGADVINLSMGWPIRFNTQYLRDAFEYARVNNVVVVAAAGNNDNSGQIFPCAYKSVICVGAVRNDGQVADFSNFGGHVDILAPGDNILSLYPMAETPLNFSVNGYDIKSGTSQAAPYVAAMVASLKAIYPSIGLDEVRGRLLSVAKPVRSKTKHSLGGLVRLSEVLKAPAKAVVRPVFKELDRVNYSQASGQFSFKLPIRSYWKNSSQVQVVLEALSPHIQFKKSEFSISSLQVGADHKLNVQGELLDVNAHSEFAFEVSLMTREGLLGPFKHQVTMTRNIESDPSVIRVPVKLVGNPKDLGLRTLSAFKGLSSSPSYYRVIENKNSEKKVTGLTFESWGIEAGELVMQSQVEFPQALRIISVLQVDANYDGEQDFMFRLGIKRGEKFFLEYAFYDKNLKPLYGEYSHWNLEYEGIQLNSVGLGWLPVELKELGQVAVPVFIREGFIPDADVNPKLTDYEVNQPESRVYFFEPRVEKGAVRLITRNFNNYKFKKKINQDLQLRHYEEQNILALNPQSLEDLYAGRLQMVLSTGQDNIRNYFVVEVTAEQLLKNQFSLGQANYGHELIDSQKPQRVIDLNQSAPNEASQLSFAGLFSTSNASVTYLDKSSAHLLQRVDFSQSDEKDHVLGFVQGYVRQGSLFNFYQTKSTMVLQVAGPNGAAKEFTQPLKRSQFWDCMLFNSCFYPVTAGGAGDLKSPALYVDETQLSGRHVYVWVGDEQGLKIPAKLNIEVSTSCTPRNPVKIGEGGEQAFSFLCKTANGWELQYLPIK